MRLIKWLDDSGVEYQRLKGGIRVGGSLDLRGTSITQLPDNLSVGGYLDLEGTSITQLPDNLSVGGYLDLEGTSITQLPDNLSVGGSLDLRGTSITQLPDNLSVGGYRINSGADYSIEIHPRENELSIGCTRGAIDWWVENASKMADQYGESISDYLPKVNQLLKMANMKEIVLPELIETA